MRRTSTRWILAVLLTGLFVSGCTGDWWTARGTPAGTASDPSSPGITAASVSGLRQAWSAPDDINHFSPPTIIDGGVVFDARRLDYAPNSSLSAYVLGSGQQLWQRKYPAAVAPLAAAGGVVFLGFDASSNNPEGVLAVRETDGSPVWIWANDRNDGDPLSAVVGDGRVFFAFGGILHAFDAASGRQLWTPCQAVTCPLDAEGGMAYANHRLFVSGLPNYAAVALNPVTGARQQAFALAGVGEYRHRQPFVVGNTLYVVDSTDNHPTAGSGHLVAYDLGNCLGEAAGLYGPACQPNRITPLADPSIAGAASAGRIYVAGVYGTVSAIDQSTGRVLWRGRIPGTGLGVDVVVSGSLVYTEDTAGISAFSVTGCGTSQPCSPLWRHPITAPQGLRVTGDNVIFEDVAGVRVLA